MNVDKFANQIKAMRWRVNGLRKHNADKSPLQKQMLAEIFKEVESALEELHVTEEELRQQNKAQEASRESVEAECQRYQELFEFAPDGYLMTDTVGTIWKANRTVAKLLNVSQRFLVDKPLIIFVEDDARLNFHAKLTQLQKTEQLQEWEVRLSPRQSESFDAALTMSAVRNQEGKMFAIRICVRDITDRKRLEAKLRQSEERYRAIVEAQTELVCRFLPDKTLTFVNHAYCRYIGKWREELLGNSFMSIIPAQDQEEVENDFASLSWEKPVASNEHRVVLPGGERWLLWSVRAIFDEQGCLVEYQLVGQDITQRKQAEVALQQQIERANLLGMMCDRIRQSLNTAEILNTTVAEVRQFLACDRVVIYRFQPDWSGVVIVESLSPEGTSMLNITIRNSYFEENYVPRYQQNHISAIDDIYRAGLDECDINRLAEFQIRANLVVPILQKEIQELESSLSLWGLLIAHHCTAPRQWQPFEIDLLSSLATQVAIAIQQAHLYQQLCTINSALESQVQERTTELQEKVRELQELNILKDDFLSTVSHELRTPLSNMKMAIQMLKTTSLPERQQRYLEICQAECNREAELINDLLDLQRLQAQFYPVSLSETVDLQHLLPTIVEPFHSRVQACQQTLQVDISPNLPPVISDRAGLARVLVELLNNACKYTPAGGQIILCVSHHPEPPIISFTIRNQAEIPEAALSRIFEKFYRVPNGDPWKQGGTGLGLALVQKLVEHLRGTIQLESTDGWTSFTVELPS